MSGVFLKLDKYEGPLDLLLHLIKLNEIDIFNIDIVLLANQYLKYLRLMAFDDLTDAGDFVDMAATLIEIKSRTLLPNVENQATDTALEDDPAADLQRRLIEYEGIQRAAEFFRSRPQLGVEILTNQEWQRLAPYFEGVEGPLKGDPVSLVLLYEQILKDFKERKPLFKVEAVTNRVGVQEVMEKISNLLGTVKFTLFQAFYKDFKSRYELVVYILAVLEMSRWGKAKLYQEGTEGPLWVYQADFDEDLLPVKRYPGAALTALEGASIDF